MAGGRRPTVSDAEILSVFVSHDDPVLSGPEVAAELPIEESGAYRRLRKLHEAGLIQTKKVGRSRIWWITDAGREHVEEKTRRAGLTARPLGAAANLSRTSYAEDLRRSSSTSSTELHGIDSPVVWSISS